MMELSCKNIILFLGIFYFLSALRHTPTYVLAIRGTPGSEVVQAQLHFPPRGSRAVPLSIRTEEMALKRMRNRWHGNNMAKNQRPGQAPRRVQQPGPKRGQKSRFQGIVRFLRPGPRK
ncbi:uncharacterized protein LOC142769146 [Rhipicephalus microplus]|uniref:uncharacterized protein LOC142769146 n=1 Tax=Rhipicephalus microplus TaxID=6941 RepID=UPI003F6AC5C5